MSSKGTKCNMGHTHWEHFCDKCRGPMEPDGVCGLSIKRNDEYTEFYDFCSMECFSLWMLSDFGKENI